ncbi:MAG TPA: dihydropteroate synthase [Candidatus Gastranaerophilaceae bacterium]|nr:dihydropteroate synthase [Candidatus Gastranaerophilaceae bacterium]HPT41021.1 dihydropteroate synthase [Candidatus Gastranaerophilaceae bacterium]
MLLIGENIHIISKSVQNALIERDEFFILDLIKKQSHLDYIDLNVGPAKNQMQGILPWLCKLVEQNSNLKISFDTTNFDEMKAGLQKSKSPQNCLLNSTSADEEKLEKMTSLTADFGSNLIALTMNKQIGIPKSADDRLNLAFEIIEKTSEKGIENKKIFFDPLILPVSVAQDQAQEALNTIQMIKQSFEPEVMTTIGLSNISNGSPAEIRPLINKIFLILAYGAGLDSAIINSLDFDLINTVKMLETSKPKSSTDELCINLSEMIRDFGQIEDVAFDTQDIEQVKIIKTAKILLNKEIYSHSFLN